MRIPELRKAVQVMDEDQLTTLGCLFCTFTKAEGEDSTYYAKRLKIVEDELEKSSRPRVDSKLARKPYYWEKM